MTSNADMWKRRCERYEKHMADNVPQQYWPELFGQVDTHVAAPAEPVPDEACFYVLDARTVVGNCAMWWCPNSQGYTCELGKAGLYTAKQCEDMRSTDIKVHRDVVARLTLQHVRVDHLRQAGVLDEFDAAQTKPSKRGRKSR